MRLKIIEADIRNCQSEPNCWDESVCSPSAFDLLGITIEKKGRQMDLPPSILNLSDPFRGITTVITMIAFFIEGVRREDRDLRLQNFFEEGD